MAYDEYLAERVALILEDKGVLFDEKKMFGGVCFMVDEKMCLGIIDENLMARVGPDQYEPALKQEGCFPLQFKKTPLRGFVEVHPEGTDTDDDLEHWIQLSLNYNPIAKKTKKKVRS